MGEEGVKLGQSAAEVAALIATHALVASAHHTKYTGAEALAAAVAGGLVDAAGAISAVGAPALITTHKSDASAHHTKYTDAEAKAAAVRAGAITDAETKAPTHDAVYDVKVTADAASAAKVPSGGIIIWTGTIANIPSGWVICDGNNGTPNLLARFVEGVATAATNPGTTGGAATHRHNWSAGGGDFAIEPTAGLTDYQSNLPPFYDIAFIMKT